MNTIYRASLEEVSTRFGRGTAQRRLVTGRLEYVYELVRRTGKPERFINFGSYVTSKAEPNDVDIILIMRDDFQEQDYTAEVIPVLDHLRAQRELGVSVFRTRPGALPLETVDEFLEHWQVKRDLGRRGIVEIVVELT